MCYFDRNQTRKKRKTKTTAEKMTIMMTTWTMTATRSEGALIWVNGRGMKREHFVNVVEQVFDSLPQNFAMASVTLLFWWGICR